MPNILFRFISELTCHFIYSIASRFITQSSNNLIKRIILYDMFSTQGLIVIKTNTSQIFSPLFKGQQKVDLTKGINNKSMIDFCNCSTMIPNK